MAHREQSVSRADGGGLLCALLLAGTTSRQGKARVAGPNPSPGARGQSVTRYGTQLIAVTGGGFYLTAWSRRLS